MALSAPSEHRCGAVIPDLVLVPVAVPYRGLRGGSSTPGCAVPSWGPSAAPHLLGLPQCPSCTQAGGSRVAACVLGPVTAGIFFFFLGAFYLTSTRGPDIRGCSEQEGEKAQLWGGGKGPLGKVLAAPQAGQARKELGHKRATGALLEGLQTPLLRTEMMQTRAAASCEYGVQTDTRPARGAAGAGDTQGPGPAALSTGAQRVQGHQHRGLQQASPLPSVF